MDTYSDKADDSNVSATVDGGDMLEIKGSTETDSKGYTGSDTDSNANSSIPGHYTHDQIAENFVDKYVNEYGAFEKLTKLKGKL